MARSRLALGALCALALPVALVVGLAGIAATQSRASCTEPLSAPAGASHTALAQIPRWLFPIYVGAAERYGLGPAGWAYVASINDEETSFGANLSVSPTGAEGWMQFEPETWARYGVSADPSEPGAPPDPYDPWDAIYAAARYLHASGAPGDWAAAIFAYNHASWYVAEVSARAESYLASPRAVTIASTPPTRGGEDAAGAGEAPAGAERANAAAAGVSVRGPGTVVSGREAGVVVRDAATVGGYWRVAYPDGRILTVRQLAVGPPAHGRGAPVLGSTAAALREAGYSEAARYPRGALVQASYLGSSPSAAEAARGAACTPEATPDSLAGRVEAAADRLAAMAVPYVYGGGHVTPAVPDPGLDCSSSVSWVLQHAGIAVATMTSGEFETWGEAGPGRYVTMYANAGHVFMAIRSAESAPWRYFGTSGFGHPQAPNGTGPAWFTVAPAAGYLAGFVMRHPVGL
jgi:hypothetical protein